MDKLFISVELKSPALIGSGEGWGTLIDSDVVYDKWGLPSIPARRLKGLLRESALEVIEMLSGSGTNPFETETFKRLFGEAAVPGTAIFCNLQLAEYDEVMPWLNWAFYKCGDLVSTETVIDCLTEIRQQTAIDEDGKAKDSSLRTVRLLRKGLRFIGPIYGEVNGLERELLALACANLRRIGGTRNRGFGEVSCKLVTSNQDYFASAIQRIKEDA